MTSQKELADFLKNPENSQTQNIEGFRMAKMLIQQTNADENLGENVRTALTVRTCSRQV